jgi:hypothetical protein
MFSRISALAVIITLMSGAAPVLAQDDDDGTATIEDGSLAEDAPDSATIVIRINRNSAFPESRLPKSQLPQSQLMTSQLPRSKVFGVER